MPPPVTPVTAKTAPAPPIEAAGALPWRERDGKLEVALVHRPRYDDWAWSKGKLDPGETWPGAAAREVAEETGLRVRLGLPLPSASYEVSGMNGQPAAKLVRYWTAVVTGGHGRLEHEVDAVCWLTPAAAQERLSYPRDREQLAALTAAATGKHLAAWPLLLVRHAKATPRRRWSGHDWLRPLDERGFGQAEDLAGLIEAYRIRRLITSSATRCTQTLEPFTRAHRSATLHASAWLSEEGYARRPRRARDALRAEILRGGPVAICTHGPVIPDLLDLLAARVDPKDQPVADVLASNRGRTMAKGEVVVAHLVGHGPKARVVALERHLPVRRRPADLARLTIRPKPLHDALGPGR
ncbi:MAG TPA: NUDIX hydrolase [Dermatophilaceae bacterium]|nr:NUDIX hydrolase [Dermatophilaceae bacterium]